MRHATAVVPRDAIRIPPRRAPPCRTPGQTRERMVHLYLAGNPLYWPVPPAATVPLPQASASVYFKLFVPANIRSTGSEFDFYLATPNRPRQSTLK